MYNILKTIEDVAVNKGLQLPAEFQIPNIPDEAIFRRTLPKPHLILKCAFNIAFFDQNGKNISFQDLKMGNFRVAIHVVGIYIGKHGS